MKLLKISIMIVACLALLFAASSQSGVKTCHEYTNLLDEQAVGGGGAHNGLMPGMILYTDPPDLAGAPNPFSVRQLNTTNEVDAIANYGDAYFPQVVANRADLYVSFLGDEGVLERAVYYETPAGIRGLQWTQTNFCNPNAGDLEDLDGLEIWGPYSASDVNRYSVTNDWATGGTSMYNYVGGGPDTQYISQATVVAWVTNASLAPEQYTGLADDVDIDGVPIPASSFVISGGSGEIDWTLDSAIKLSATVVVSAGSFADVTATAFGSGYLTSPTEATMDFGEAIEIGDIPTITEWGFVAIVLLLVIGGAFAIVRRRRTVNA